MIKGTRIQATNAQSIGVGVNTGNSSFISSVPLLTIPTGKSFILTDLIVGFIPVAASVNGTMVAGVMLEDKAYAAAGSNTTIGNAKLVAKTSPVTFLSIGTNTGVAVQSLVLTDMYNGPEFSTCVSCTNVGTYVIATGGVFVAGVMR